MCLCAHILPSCCGRPGLGPGGEGSADLGGWCVERGGAGGGQLELLAHSRGLYDSTPGCHLLVRSQPAQGSQQAALMPVLCVFACQDFSGAAAQALGLLLFLRTLTPGQGNSRLGFRGRWVEAKGQCQSLTGSDLS